MKVAIDCRSFRKKPAGVPNILLSAINTLATLQKDYTLYLLSNEGFHAEIEARLVSSAQIKKIISPLPFLPQIAILWYLLKLPFMVRRLDADIYYSVIPNLPFWLPKKTKTLLTVHDMVYKRFPETMSSMNWWINFFLHDRSIRRADRILADSQYAKREIELCFPRRKSSDILVGAAVEKNIFRPGSPSENERRQLLQKFNTHEKFILFAGTLEPRKNLSFLMALAPDLARHGFSLLIVGAKGWGKEDFDKLKGEHYPEDKISFTGFISTDELVKLYQIASVYVSTSLNEGFGLPQLEAMCCGCPVVAAHNSAMIEMVEGAGETVQGWDRNEWINKIIKVDQHRDEYIIRGFERAKSYEWETVIRNLIKYLA